MLYCVVPFTCEYFPYARTRELWRLCDCPLIGFTELVRERREPTRRVAFVRDASIGTHANSHDFFRRRRTVDEYNLIYARTHG